MSRGMANWKKLLMKATDMGLLDQVSDLSSIFDHFYYRETLSAS